MGKKKYEFEENDWDNASEYKKVSKKKAKPREESTSSKNWRYNANQSYSGDDYEYEEDYR
jgi:hypothetical protein